MELIVQPDDGITPTLEAIASARKTLDLMIFRFDLKKVEEAAEAAVERGVAVRALIAHTNSGEEKRLRQLELRMLERGVMVARTGSDLVRYHGKMLVVDRETLHVYGFNYTSLDLESRSFGIVTKERRTVQEALKVFEADLQRKEYEPGLDGLVVSPETAREQLATFIKRARKSLAIYDPKLSDTQMIRLLRQREKAGVDVRVIGHTGKRGGDLRVQKIPQNRLHVRAMIRDNDTAFIGSQSLRGLELDARREVGIIVREAKIVKRMQEIFEEDWSKTEIGRKEQREFEKDREEEEDADIVVEAT